MTRITTIKLYGNIFEWNLNNAQMMALQIDKAADTADEIQLRIHCYGGSVIEGGMIYNAIKNSRIPVDIYVDGVAASMAAILLPAARKVYMSENAFLMIHGPAGGTDGRGTADEHLKTAKALKEMEKTFIKALVSRTGKTETEVKKWMQGDNWFSAAQALDEKLIDAITDPVAKEVKTLSNVEIQTAKVEDVYSLYTAMLDNPKTDHQKTKNEMDKEKLIASLGLTGVTAASTDEEVQAVITAKLNAEKTAKEAAENALKEQNKTQVTALLDSVKDKLTKEQRAQYEAIGENMGLAALQTIITPLSGVKSFTAAINDAASTPGNSTSRTAWNFEEWQKNDPRGLEKMAATDPESFNAIYKAAFGTDAPKQ